VQVVDLEGHVAQSQLVGRCGRRTRQVVGPDEARELQPGAVVGRLQHHDLGAGAGDAADGVEELALDEGPALDLQAQCHEERRHGVEGRDGDADVIEPSYV
jgi:hypothetical protein